MIIQNILNKMKDFPSLSQRSIINRGHDCIVKMGDEYLPFYCKALDLFNSGNILEIGTCQGGSALFSCLYLLEQGKRFQYHTFDPNRPGDSFYKAINNFGLEDVLFFHQGLSPQDTLNFLESKDVFLDMLIIDGSHVPDEEISDFYSHRSKLLKGSIVVIDDVLYNNNEWGAWKLVDKVKDDKILKQVVLKHFKWKKKKKKGKASSGIFIGEIK